MRRVSVQKASRSLGHNVIGLGNEIMVVTQGNRPVAALVPLENVDRESLALSGHPEFLALIDRARTELAAGHRLSLAEMKSRVLPGSRAVPGRRPIVRKRHTGRTP